MTHAGGLPGLGQGSRKDAFTVGLPQQLLYAHGPPLRLNLNDLLLMFYPFLLMLFLALLLAPAFAPASVRSYVTETGTGEGDGATINVPLPPGSGSGAYKAAFERLVLPALEAYRWAGGCACV